MAHKDKKQENRNGHRNVNYRLLIVEDSPDTVLELKEFFEDHAFEVAVAQDGPSFREIFGAMKFDLIIMDLTLPGEDGFRLTQLVRRESDVPIIMLTGRSDVVDRIVGLELGADDYMLKPFDPRELLARINATLRRSGKKGAPEKTSGENYITFERFRVDCDARRVFDPEGDEVAVTSSEYTLLDLFLTKAGRVLSRDALTQEVYGRAWEASDRSIDNLVMRLRSKLGEAKSVVKSIRGVGYMFAAKVEDHRS